jgi:putative acetyltransferase
MLERVHRLVNHWEVNFDPSINGLSRNFDALGSKRALIGLILRPETPSDQTAIFNLTKRAFAPMPFSDGDEPELVDALRMADALTISMVGEIDRVIVGHIAFSPATTADNASHWFALGPVSVDPGHQNKGIGRALIQTGLAHLKRLGANGCILVGNPLYYQRFGFKPCPQLAPEREPAQYFLAIEIGGQLPQGRFGFHPAFYEAQ